MLDSFRELIWGLEDISEDLPLETVLENLSAHTREYLDHFSYFKSLRTSLPAQVEEEELHEFYALSAFIDRLMYPLTVSRNRFVSFFEDVGLDVFWPENESSFNPALCEVAEVGNWPREDKGLKTAYVYWPGIRFGELILSRAAVMVLGNNKHKVIEGIADTSTLYFTHARFRRKRADLSDGWGHNSRWRTRFSRNYVTEQHIFLNVDGEIDLHEGLGPEGDRGVSIDLAREVLFNKCCVSQWPSGQGEDDLWPYDWKMAVRNTSAPWPLQESSIIPFESGLILEQAKTDGEPGR